MMDRTETVIRPSGIRAGRGRHEVPPRRTASSSRSWGGRILPKRLRGVPLRESAIRQLTGCHVVAFQDEDGVRTSPPAEAALPSAPDSEIILVGMTSDEHRFMKRFNTD